MYKRAVLLLMLAVGFGVYEAYLTDDEPPAGSAMHVPPGDGRQSLRARPVTYTGGASLQPRQGTYFRYTIPANWQANETTNGLDFIAPDGRTGASFILLMGAFGAVSPLDFIAWRFQSMGIYDVRWLSQRNLPHQPGPGGYPWRVAEAEVTYTYRGTPVRAYVLGGIVQGMNQFCAFMRGYQAPTQTFERDRSLLSTIDQSVVITNPIQVAGLRLVSLPKGTSHDEMFGGYNEGWQARQPSTDRWSKGGREGMLGSERVKDPLTGQIYEPSLGDYDPTEGGYRNPLRPAELLMPTQPGE